MSHREVYYIYFDVPTTLNSTTATFADNTAVMAVGETVENSARKLSSAAYKVPIWTKKIVKKLNESISVHTDFTNRKIRQQPIFINGIQVPYAYTVERAMSSTSSSGKCIGCLDTILSCQTKIN
jgi:capsid portal protein